MKFNFVRFACSCLTLIGLTSTATASEYYRRITPEELKKERTQKKCEFVWSEMGEKLISEMAIDYQNALFVTNMNSEVDSKKAEMQEKDCRETVSVKQVLLAFAGAVLPVLIYFIYSFNL